MILIKDLEGGASFEDKVASIRGTPEAVNIHNVWSNSSNRDFEKTPGVEPPQRVGVPFQ